MNPFHVDASHRVTEGDAALPLVARDRDPAGPDGVLEVSAERWAVAQAYERACWLDIYPQLGDDRSEDHARGFDWYRCLRGQRFKAALEVGCGPFTQTRQLVKRGAVIEDVTLTDPLVESYRQHPLCAYEALSKGRKVRAVAAALEDLEGRFDLVISINVLEHCRSYPEAMQRLRFLVAPGGVLVFGDSAIQASRLEESLERIWDAGHPLRVTDSRMLRDLGGMDGKLLHSRVIEGRYGLPWRRELYRIVRMP